jgi:DNA-directed RNA polymerase specialized sigma subunit
MVLDRLADTPILVDTLAFYTYRTARGKKKAALLAELVAAEEPLVQRLAARFLGRINIDTSHIREDVLQAARIGILRAVQTWEPCRGSFLTVAWGWTRLEMQRVMGHAAPVSYPRSLLFDGGFQHEAAVFYAKHGRDPTPEELHVPARKRLAHGRVPAKFVSLAKAEKEVAEEPRDEAAELEAEKLQDEQMKTLQFYLATLTKSERTALLAGKRADLFAAAKAYVTFVEGTKR